MGARVALVLALGLLEACSKGTSSTPALEPFLPADFSGVWSGDAGPNLAALKFGARIEIREDGGTISGEFFNEDPEKPGVYRPTGEIRGTRDGGLLLLTAGNVIDLSDGGRIEPQLLLLNYEGGKLVGFRKLQLPGRPALNEYLILRK